MTRLSTLEQITLSLSLLNVLFDMNIYVSDRTVSITASIPGTYIIMFCSPGSHKMKASDITVCNETAAGAALI